MINNINKYKVQIATLGCAKNFTDSEELATQLKNNNINISENEGEIVIINTCGFITSAKEESVNTILEAIKLKKQGKIKYIIVMGCLVARYEKELKKELPEVDAFFPPWNKDKSILNLFDAIYKKELIGERTLAEQNHFAYLKISEGCNRKCGFCAIPKIRGAFTSKPIETILTEARRLADAGTKELILIAQDLAYYGLDLYKKPMLPELVEKLSQIEKIEWIRLHYLYPDKLFDNIIPVLKNNPKVCNYVDIPVQHTSDNVLKTMRRGTSRKKIYEIVERLRKEIPDIAIRTSLIVGYPTETEKDFLQLQQDIKELQFDRLGVFLYSNEDNTFAYEKYGDNISQEEKERRREIIMQIQQDISRRKNQELVGKTLKVLIDEEYEDVFIGRTEYDSPEVDNTVIIKADNLAVGEFANVRIYDATEYDLYGEVSK